MSGIVTCGDKQSQFLFSGFQLETIGLGWVLMVQGVTFVSAFNPKIAEKEMVSVFKGNVSFGANMTALNSSCQLQSSCERGGIIKCAAS